MVTSKRKVTQDTAYDYEAPVASPAERKSGVTFNDDLMMMRSYVEPSAEPVPADPVYKTVTKNEPVREQQVMVEKKAVRVADIMPVIAAKRTIKAETEKAPETTRREKMLSPVMKKALIAYLSVIVILTIAVIATGVVINSVSAEINAAEAESMSMSQTIALQQAELERLADPEYLGTIAKEELNMTEINSVITGKLVDVKQKQAETATNPFDAFCDWISSIFGG